MKRNLIRTLTSIALVAVSASHDLLKVEIVPNADLNTEYFLVDGDLVQISGEGTMWVLIDYLEKYAAYW